MGLMGVPKGLPPIGVAYSSGSASVSLDENAVRSILDKYMKDRGL
jgi:hypothetical protein